MPDTALTALIDPGEQTGPVIVLLHGRGSDERDLFPVGKLLHAGATTVSVRAPFPAAPWGYGPGYAWYRFLGGTTPESDSFERGQEALATFIERLPEQLGRSIESLVVGGFSQGGTSALGLAMRHPGRASAVIVFSGFLADHPSVRVSHDRVGTTPIFWGHGTADQAVPFAAAEDGWRQLRDAKASLDARSYPGMGHTISEAEIRDAREWLARTLAASPAGQP